MLVDVVMVRDELDLLDVRLDTYRGLVDMFVVVEGTRTFGAGEPKPCHVAETDRFAGSDICRAVVDDFPDGASPWAREAHQRNAVLFALDEFDDDVKVMFGDVDEFPAIDVVADHAAGRLPDQLTVCEHRHMVFAVNLEHPTPELGTTMATIGDMRSLTPQGLREARHGALKVRSGFHFSWLGDLAAKAAATSHTEFANLNYDTARAEQRTPWDDATLTRVALDGTWPAPMRTGRLPDGWVA